MPLKATIVGLAIILSLLVLPTKSDAEPQIIIPTPKTIDQYIQEIFGNKADIATAVFKHESQLNLDAKGYNCMYGGKSKACKPQDRSKAWSVDCGIAQVNVKGKVCPDELLTLEGNMEAVEKIYKAQGLNAWVSFKSGAYKKFL